MFHRLKKITFQLLVGANIATIIFMFVVGYADRINPVDYPLLSVAGLSFPVFLLINFLFLVFWLLFKWRSAAVPVLGFICCYAPIREYCPLNLPKDVPGDALKVLSYNVWLFRGWDYPTKDNPILRYLVRQDADIVCLQEADRDGIRQETIDSVMDKVYEYKASARIKGGGDKLVLYSHFPILRHEDIPYESESNHSTAFYLKVNGDTMLVINNHLESLGLTEETKEQFKSMVKGELNSTKVKAESMSLTRAIAQANRRRAPQADAILRYIDDHSRYSVILCGDFNDGPISYARHVLSKRLQDCFVESGNGFGISYHHKGFYVRIDNMMCSGDFEIYKTKVDNSIAASDHYPIYSYIKKKRKP